MDEQNFSTWPQTDLSRPVFTYFRRPTFPHTHRQPLTVRTMPSNPRDMSESGMNTHGNPVSATSNFSSSSGDANPGSSRDGSSFFDEWFQYPDDSISTGDIVGVPQWREPQQALHNLPFRANEAESNSASYGLTTSALSASNGEAVIQSPENSPGFLGHPTFQSTVDTSRYQVIRDDEWIWSSVENGDSPGFVNPGIGRPFAGTSPAGGDGFLRPTYGHGANSGTFVPKVESTPFGGSTLPSSFQSFSSNFGSSHSSFSSAASFGSMTNMGSYAQQQGTAAPSSTLPPSVAFQGHFARHSHGLPMPSGTSGAGQSVPPQQIFTHPPTVLPDLERDFLENSTESSDDDTEPESDIGDQTVANAHERRDKDKKLLKMREMGLSYKEIKRRGKFREAESTLRGRVRVLTKDKSERVRSPKWTDNDVQLLERAIAHFEGTDVRYGQGRDVHGRVPWKKISDWMMSHGSSYHFAPATCAKKWKEQN